MRFVTSLLVLAAATLVSTGAQAQTQTQSWSNPDRFAAGVTLGTDGAGIDLKYRVSPTIVLRLRGAGFDASGTENSDGIHYRGHVRMATGGGFVDWHPFANGWMLSGGVVGGERHIDLSGSSAASVRIGGNTYTPAQIGTVSGRADMPSVAGFAGVGYDSTFVHRWPVGVSVLVGAQLSSAPKVHLSANGLLATTPQLNADLVSEENELRHDLDFVRYYPAVSLGLSYRF